MATERLQVILQLAAGQYKREARQAATATGTVAQQAKGAATATGGLQNKMVGFGSVLRGAAVLGGVAALGRGIGESIGRAEEMQSAYAITEQVIRQTGGAANLTADEIKNLSKEQSLLTGVDKALVTEGNNVLLTFKNIKNEAGEGNDVFERTSNLMLDISATMGTDAKSAALQLGKALNDPIANMGALSRAGLTFTQEQKDQIKALVASGNLLEAQRLILAELESQLGGTAEASADATDKIANHFKELSEQIGTALLPVLEQAVPLLGALFASTDVDRWAIQTGAAAKSGELLGFSLAQIAKESRNTIGLGLATGGVEDLADAFRRIIKEGDFADDALRKVRDGLDFLTASGHLTAKEAEILADIIADDLAPTSRDMADNAIALEEELDALRGTTDKYATSAFEAVPSADALAFEMERQESAARNARKEMAEYRTALREIVDPVSKIIRLSQEHTEKQDALSEAVDTYTINSDEAREAALELASTNSELRTAFDELRTQGIDPTSAAAQLMFEDLGIPPEVLEGILSEFQSIQAYLDANPLRMRAIPPSLDLIPGAGQKRHSGGPGQAGQPYVIRPNEEIFVPSGNGQFLLNDQVINAVTNAIKGLSGGNTSTHNYNIPITSTGNQNADAQLVGAVASVLRRMETL